MKQFRIGFCALMCLIITMVISALFFSACHNRQETLHNNHVNMADLVCVDEQNADVQNIIRYVNLPYGTEKTFSRVIYLSSLKKAGLAGAVRYNRERYYTVDKLSDGRYMFLLLSLNGNDLPTEDNLMVEDGCIVSDLMPREVFKTVQIGMRKEEILALDKNAEVGENCSSHRFSDGSVVAIRYETMDNQEVVVEMTETDNTDSVFSCLLAKDLKEIQ